MKKTIKDIDWAGKKAVMRCDFNVPLDGDTITDDIRIRAALPSIEYLLENGAVSMHDSLGRWIRNEWGLWTDSELKNELNKKGFDHPDDMSNYIIEEFIKYWNGKRID